MTDFGTLIRRQEHQSQLFNTRLVTLNPTTHTSMGPRSEATHPQIQRWSGPAPCY